jgi:phosphoribosylformylglycinamidine synthase
MKVAAGKRMSPERPWLYQTPEQILIKASNGASDFGNKFGQPLICGSVLTFEHVEKHKKFAYDKVIMLAGGIGFAKEKDWENTACKGDKIVVLGWRQLPHWDGRRCCIISGYR